MTKPFDWKNFFWKKNASYPINYCLLRVDIFGKIQKKSRDKYFVLIAKNCQVHFFLHSEKKSQKSPKKYSSQKIQQISPFIST